MRQRRGNARVATGRQECKPIGRDDHAVATTRRYSRRNISVSASAHFVPMAPAIVRAQASDLPSGPIKVILPTLPVGRPTRSAA